MKVKVPFKTETIQSLSNATLCEAGKNVKPKTEDNMSLLLSVFDSLNNLNDKLNKLNYAVERKIVEQNLYQKNKEL